MSIGPARGGGGGLHRARPGRVGVGGGSIGIMGGGCGGPAIPLTSTRMTIPCWAWSAKRPGAGADAFTPRMGTGGSSAKALRHRDGGRIRPHGLMLLHSFRIVDLQLVARTGIEPVFQP